MPAINNSLIVFGSVVQDLVSYVERIPNPGETVCGKSFNMSCGGKGANQAVMAAILGAKVSMVGRVGNDIFGDLNINSIKSYGVDVSLMDKNSKQFTGTATVCVSADGENCIIVTLGSNLDLGAKRALELESEISKAKLIICQSEIDQLGNVEAFKIAKRHGITTFFNPAPGRSDLNMEILNFTDIICTNENEAECITGMKLKTIEDYEKAAKRMLEFGLQISIITLGFKGALIVQHHPITNQITVNHVSAPKVTAVDTVGAGDCFCGTFAYFYLKNPAGDVVEMVRKAVITASLSVTKIGTQTAYPTREELVKANVL